MACLSVIVRRVSAASAALSRVGNMDITLTRVGGLTASLSRITPLSVSVTRIEPMTCRVGLVCGTNIDTRPGILWASDGRLITIEGGFLIPNGR